MSICAWHRDYCGLCLSSAKLGCVTGKSEKSGGSAHTLILTAETASGDQSVEFNGANDGGYAGAAVRALCDGAQVMAGEQSGLRLKVARVAFDRGQSLLDWLQATGQTFNASEVEQASA